MEKHIWILQKCSLFDSTFITMIKKVEKKQIEHIFGREEGIK